MNYTENASLNEIIKLHVDMMNISYCVLILYIHVCDDMNMYPIKLPQIP